MPSRTNVILSSSNLTLPSDCIHIKNLDDLNEFDFDIDWVIGGAGLINSVWDQITEFHLSHRRDEYKCDTIIDLQKLQDDFILKSSQMCLTHDYEVYVRQ